MAASSTRSLFRASGSMVALSAGGFRTLLCVMVLVCENRLHQYLHAAAHMARERAFQHAEPRGRFLLRESLDSSEPDDVAAVVRELVEPGCQTTQLLARAQAMLGGNLVYQDVQGVQILRVVDGYDALAADAVREQVAG